MCVMCVKFMVRSSAHTCSNTTDGLIVKTAVSPVARPPVLNHAQVFYFGGWCTMKASRPPLNRRWLRCKTLAPERGSAAHSTRRRTGSLPGSCKTSRSLKTEVASCSTRIQCNRGPPVVVAVHNVHLPQYCCLMIQPHVSRSSSPGQC
jgi:hypothetical protein